MGITKRMACASRPDDPYGATFDAKGRECTALSADAKATLGAGMGFCAFILLLVAFIWGAKYTRRHIKRRRAATGTTQLTPKSTSRTYAGEYEYAHEYAEAKARAPLMASWGAAASSSSTPAVYPARSQIPLAASREGSTTPTQQQQRPARSPGGPGSPPSPSPSTSPSWGDAADEPADRAAFALPLLSAEGHLLPPPRGTSRPAVVRALPPPPPVFVPSGSSAQTFSPTQAVFSPTQTFSPTQAVPPQTFSPQPFSPTQATFAPPVLPRARGSSLAATSAPNSPRVLVSPGRSPTSPVGRAPWHTFSPSPSPSPARERNIFYPASDDSHSQSHSQSHHSHQGNYQNQPGPSRNASIQSHTPSIQSHSYHTTPSSHSHSSIAYASSSFGHEAYADAVAEVGLQYPSPAAPAGYSAVTREQGPAYV